MSKQIKLMYELVSSHGRTIDYFATIKEAREELEHHPLAHIEYIGAKGHTLDEINAYQNFVEHMTAMKLTT